MVISLVQTFNVSLYSLINADTFLFFITEDGQIGKSDGTTAGTQIFSPTQLTESNGELYIATQARFVNLMG